jgi:hypothetical protein
VPVVVRCVKCVKKHGANAALVGACVGWSVRRLERASVWSVRRLERVCVGRKMGVEYAGFAYASDASSGGWAFYCVCAMRVEQT